MPDVILEIGTEEMPVNCIENALKDLKRLTSKQLDESKINYKNMEVFATPRRLILSITQLIEKQEDVLLKVKGPSANIAFDNKLNPQKPAIKFAQSQGVKAEELIIEDTKKGKYIYAMKSIKGKSSLEILQQAFPEIIKNLSFPKSMRWGSGNLRFVRPIRWIFAMYRENLIRFKLDGLISGKVSYGHKLLSKGQINISSSETYFYEMKKGYVITDPIERKDKIKQEILKIINENGGEKIINQEQLNEINYMVEYPHAILGHFDRHYLELPIHVLVTVMEVHQKYFPVYKTKDELTNCFIVVINNSKHNDEVIIKGNENVLKARLEDAKFFFKEDIKKPLEEKVEQLKNVVFRENTGNLFDKTNRITDLSQFIAATLNMKQKEREIISRSAYLCKADLVTEMVKEFPKLQGIMGKDYALLSREKIEVATTIYEHYLPRFSEDKLPETKTGMVLSIADKIDNIIGCFATGLIPTGSQDPYGLRRQAFGIVRTIIENKLEISLEKIIEYSLLLYKKNISLELKENDEKIIYDIIHFLQQRLKNILLDRGIYYDVIDAVLAAEKNGDFNDIQLRIQIMQKWYHSDVFRKIVNSSTRVMNLSKKGEELDVDDSLFKKKEEITLWRQFKKYDREIDKYINRREYCKVFTSLEELCVYVDDFFDKVLVMDREEIIRKNRIGLIKKISILFNHVAVLSKISLKKEE